jgi:CRISPR-associated endonuclease/helicase Cas3
MQIIAQTNDGPKPLIAHTGKDRDQDLYDHLFNVANLTKKFAKNIDSSDLPYSIGLNHDKGKATQEFRDRLKKILATFDHTYNGAQDLFNLLQNKNNKLAALFIINGHHYGLGDNDVVGPIRTNKYTYHTYFDELNEILKQTNIIESNIPDDVRDIHIRMLFSCLVDADYTDTASFYGLQRDLCSITLHDLYQKFTANQNQLMSQADQTNIVNQYRNQIFEDCLDAADLPPGIFVLAAPTGGGKFRSAIGFALKHALKYNKDRIFYIAPYQTILNQTADISIDIFGKEPVLIHHSGIEYKVQPDDDGIDNKLNQMHKLATETWEHPIVNTTNVRFLESLFSANPVACRRLHNTTNAVIIADEIQSLPTHLLGPIMNEFKRLTEHYGWSIILTTATHPDYKLLLPNTPITEVVKNPDKVFWALRRVDYNIDDTEHTYESLVEQIQKYDNILVIVNTRNAAMQLALLLKDNPNVLHLSRNMYGEHCLSVIKEIIRRNKSGEKCVVITTQMVEAGVDIDFSVVYREIGPIDSVIQAGGRCNRNGKMDTKGQVFIFHFNDELTTIPPSYKTAVEIAKQKMTRPDFHNPSWCTECFRELHSIKDLDSKGIKKLQNDLNFKSIGSEFKMIEQDCYPILINEGGVLNQIINKLKNNKNLNREDFRLIQNYSVNFYPHNLVKHKDLCKRLADGIYLWVGDYSQLYGVVCDEQPIYIV